MTPIGFAYLASALATGTGAVVAYRSRAHLPIALLLGFGLGADAIIRACGPSPSGWRFALSLSLGSAYPWAVLGVVSVSLRREGRRGNEGRSHVGRSPSLRGGVGAQAAPGPADSVAQDGGGVGDCAGGVNEDPGDEVRGDDAEQAHQGMLLACGDGQGSEFGQPPHVAEMPVGPFGRWLFRQKRKESGRDESGHARILAGIALLFTLYLASLFSSGVRGPALARCYAAAQAGLGVGMAWVVRGWRKRAPGSGPSTSSGLTGQCSGCPLSSPLSGAGLGNLPAASSELPGEHQTYVRRAPTATEIAAIVCAAAEIANVPAALSLPSWLSARVVYFAAYIALSLVQLEALCRPLPRVNLLGRASSS